MEKLGPLECSWAKGTWCIGPCRASLSAWLAICAMASCETPSLPPSACTREGSPCLLYACHKCLSQFLVQHAACSTIPCNQLWRVERDFCYNPVRECVRIEVQQICHTCPMTQVQALHALNWQVLALILRDDDQEHETRAPAGFAGDA